MSNEQEPMPKMQASQDDIALRQKQLQQRRIAAQRAAKANPASSEQILAPAPKQTLAIVALVLAIAMSAFAGFIFIQLQEANAQLKKAEGILNGHSTNLAALNDKLSASDENSNLSVDALRILLKDNGQEIRKLWDLSNKTNKPKIAQNGKAIASVKSSVAKVDKKVGTANSNISGNKKSIASLKTSLANSQKGLEAKMDEVKASISALPAETEKRIGNNEQSIRSIDATRKKLNSSMAEVESQFNEMKLEIEDIQIRLDRMQNAMTGTL